MLGLNSVRAQDPSNTLAPHGNIHTTSGKMRAKDHLQPAEGAVLVATGDRCVSAQHHQPHTHLIGPCQTQSW